MFDLRTIQRSKWLSNADIIHYETGEKWQSWRSGIVRYVYSVCTCVWHPGTMCVIIIITQRVSMMNIGKVLGSHHLVKMLKWTHHTENNTYIYVIKFLHVKLIVTLVDPIWKPYFHWGEVKGLCQLWLAVQHYWLNQYNICIKTTNII